MNMKKCYILTAAVAAAVLAGCAKAPTVSENESSKRYIEAWIKTFHPDAQKTSLGAYILEDLPGNGLPIGDVDNSPYVNVKYTVTDLAGNIQNTTSELLSQQLGTYDFSTYYGPKVFTRLDYGVTAGINETLSTMNIGGRRKVLVPGWLLSTTEYSSADEYFKYGSGTEMIYTIEPVERITDIVQWELDSVATYLIRRYPKVSPADSISKGFYYIRTREPADTCGFHKDTTIYINYIGRLLNGKVFDTTIADTAKFYGIYDPSNSYEPMSVAAKSDYTETTLDGNTTITGFAYMIYQMHSYESGTGIFYSDWGYGSSGSGVSIPPYSPLRFDIDVVSD